VAADVNTLHLVVRAEQAARRSGTASTKTRGEVSGSTAKLYRRRLQPARSVSRRSPAAASPSAQAAQLRHQKQQEGHPGALRR
jgi:ribosomal protein L4